MKLIQLYRERARYDGGCFAFLEDLANFALDFALSQGASYAEVRIQRDSSDEALLKNGNPEVSSLVRKYGIGIRVLIHGALGFASTNMMDHKNVASSVSEAISMAKAIGGKLKKDRISDVRTKKGRARCPAF